MDSIQIEGGFPLYGSTRIQGSKNATLPILAATVLVRGVSTIYNCPRIADVASMIKILENIGCRVRRRGCSVTVDASRIRNSWLPREDVVKMRSSIMLMGALLGRTGEVFLDFPGGCVIGERPVDIHLHALQQLGAVIMEEDESIAAKAGVLRGADIRLEFPSVGATENAILAAVTAKGDTIVRNAAKEPEISSLCGFLNGAGAKITGIGTDTLYIHGVSYLRSVAYCVPGDRIVAGTYLLGCIACGGSIELTNAPVAQMDAVIQCAECMGGRVNYDADSIRILMEGKRGPVPYLKTAIYPGFPTDLQSVLLVACSRCEGISTIEETIFENRFKIVKELNSMGANVGIDDRKVHIIGTQHLHGKFVVAEELRGGAALVLAGMAAEGYTIVSNKYFIDRGYEDICGDLSRLGARVAAG